MKSQIADIFDRYAEEYDEWFRSPKGRILFQIEVEAVRLLMIDAQPPFLEIGVGTGIFAAALHITFGVDPSYKVSSIAKKRGILVASAKGEKLPFKDNTLGTIFILFTLCFVDDPMEVLEETYRLLKHGGKVILGIINKGSSWGKLYSNKKEKGDPFYFRAQFYSPDDVQQFFDKVGFKKVVYASTLLQPPSENPYFEVSHRKLLLEAGFICISGAKE